MSPVAVVLTLGCRDHPTAATDTQTETGTVPTTSVTGATGASGATGDTGDTGAPCVPVAEIAMNDADDDCDGWADELGADYPRIAILGEVVVRDTHGGLNPYGEFGPPSDLGHFLDAGWGGDGRFWVAARASEHFESAEIFGVPIGGVALHLPLESHDDLWDTVAVGTFEGTPASLVYGSRLYEGAGDVAFADFVAETPRFDTYGARPSAHDLDGDGFDELLLAAGALGDELYVFSGPVTGGGWAVPIAAVLSTDTIRYVHTIGRPADFTSDGISDLLVSSEQDAGYVRIVPGDVTGTVELLDVTVATTRGEVDGDDANRSPTAGDANGDGYQDLVVGSSLKDERRGRAYLVLGPLPEDTSLADAEATVDGDWRYDSCGWANDFAHDADGDGADELVVACPRDPTGVDAYAPGRVMVFRGADVVGSVGIASAANVYVGEGPYDLAGYQLHAHDDVDGDGFDDLVVAAPADTSVDGHTLNGTVYLVSGPLL